MARGPRHDHKPGRPYGSVVKVVGIEACRALFARRPQAIEEIHLIREVRVEFGDLLAYGERQRIPCRDVSVATLTQLCETPRHDGICLLAKKKPLASVEALIGHVDRNRGPMVIPLFDNLKNPNNVGALLRVAGYFGATHVVAHGEGVGLSMAAMRTAEGAAEDVELLRPENSRHLLGELKRRGFKVIATSSHAKRVLGEQPLPARAVIMLGAENAGLAPELTAEADVVVAIPGAGVVESLNVATAAAVILWEHWRHHHKADLRPAPHATSRGRT